MEYQPDFNQDQKDAIDYREQEYQRELEMQCWIMEQINRDGFVSVEMEAK